MPLSRWSQQLAPDCGRLLEQRTPIAASYIRFTHRKHCQHCQQHSRTGIYAPTRARPAATTTTATATTTATTSSVLLHITPLHAHGHGRERELDTEPKLLMLVKSNYVFRNRIGMEQQKCSTLKAYISTRNKHCAVQLTYTKCVTPIDSCWIL